MSRVSAAWREWGGSRGTTPPEKLRLPDLTGNFLPRQGDVKPGIPTHDGKDPKTQQNSPMQSIPRQE